MSQKEVVTRNLNLLNVIQWFYCPTNSWILQHQISKHMHTSNIAGFCKRQVIKLWFSGQIMHWNLICLTCIWHSNHMHIYMYISKKQGCYRLFCLITDIYRWGSYRVKNVEKYLVIFHPEKIWRKNEFWSVSTEKRNNFPDFIFWHTFWYYFILCFW